ncbi:GNAT family N-acetyltransferase [Alkalibaculum sp. M08DMB]|uniref:GNAT family N-acetyltransferase n=1 Tax=Alkalibaculum sporogenes TaxID=2655001 RepID=A0A6A7KBW0_9FIRM|nr:GNAT family N-acetyltransferase [Alkalibaculum sporogenes]MPW26845.1 GNAT family N-acetyltransferase [Alkalibaculum sporogenes]
MNQYEIKVYAQLNNIQKEEAIGVFLEGFGHMMTFSKDNEELKCLFTMAFHPFYIYAYLENGKVLGILGIASNCIRPIKIDINQSVKVYGKFKGSIIGKQMNLVFQRQVVKKNTDIYIDVLATTKNARGRGVATRLLEYAFSLPKYEECYIEVLSKNLNAKKLYEKSGFIAYQKKPLSYTSLMGFGYPIRMKRDLI